MLCVFGEMAQLLEILLLAGMWLRESF